MAVQKELMLLFCVSGIYACYMVYALLQERVTKQGFGPDKKARFKYPMFLVTAQCLVNFGFALIMSLFRAKGPSIPVGKFFWVSAAYITAMFASNLSLNYIDYPTQVLAKSCKMIPVMLMGVVFLKRKYSSKEYLAVFAITLGIASFMLKKNPYASGHVSFTWSTNAILGGLCVLTSLGMDGVVGTLQETLMHKEKPTGNQLMMYMNMWSVVILAFGLVGTGEGSRAVAFCTEYHEVLYEILAFSLCSALGQFFIFLTITNFGALACSMVTTTRKFFTILASVIYFGHDLTTMQWGGVAGVFAGLFVNLWVKYSTRSTVITVKKQS